jgi:uncharacterized repeat protein (TIGR01451 family)
MLPQRKDSTRQSRRPARAHQRGQASPPRPRTISRLMRWSFSTALAFCLFLALQTPGLARLIFDINDSAFREAILEPFDTSNAAQGATRFTITRAGVQLTFSTTSASGIFFCSGGNCRLQAPFPEGIDIDISPPVPAIGFQHTWIENPGRATFTGSLGTETFTFPRVSSLRGSFVGATDIGPISHVRLESTRTPSERWDDMRFVPPPPPPATPTPTPTPALHSNLVANKTGPAFVGNNQHVAFDVTVANRGPDAATGVQVVDFLPHNVTFTGSFPTATLTTGGGVATINLADIPPNFGSRLATLNFDTPPFSAFGCHSRITNIALATSSSIETDHADNLSVASTSFDNSSHASLGEICDNQVDDDCDGQIDCADLKCGCYPPLPSAPSPPSCILLPPLSTCTSTPPSGSPSPSQNPAAKESCGPFLNSAGEEVTLPPYCCDSEQNTVTEDATCKAIDPNFKEADPAVNAAGYGYTAAGRTMTYRLHYENVGGVAAHDVAVVDVLPDDLDPSTLVLNDGGTYNPSSRAIVWRDALVPPATPRSVSFSAAVRADAPHGTRIRNSGTIIFPDAVPPSRIDTNFVEHFVLGPGVLVEPVLKVFQCTQTSPGEWQVDLVNEGYGFAYNVTASIINPPASVNVTAGTAAVFKHPDDTAQLSTVIPLAATTSTDTVRFTTQTSGDPCGALTWRIRYQNSRGEQFTRDVRDAPDRDSDAVPDPSDNCPDTYNPTQADADADGAGNACDSDDDNDGQADADEIACGSDPLDANSQATDTDADHSPDCVDADDDNDGVADAADNCLRTPNPDQSDADRDGRGDACDNCPATPNPGQEDADSDGVGEACENVAPDCGGAYASIQEIWSPNHHKIAVSVLGVTDADGDLVRVHVDRVMQDEPTDGAGDGNTCPDAYIPPDGAKAYVLAERAGGGNGRVYTIYFTATDGRGGSCSGSVKVSVPHDQSSDAVDDGPRYDSTVCTSWAKPKR